METVTTYPRGNSGLLLDIGLSRQVGDLQPGVICKVYLNDDGGRKINPARQELARRIAEAVRAWTEESEAPAKPDEIAPGQFERSKLTGYDVEPDGFRGGWRARDPEGDELPGPDGVGEDPHPTERAAWEACDRHRMFGEG